MSGTGNLKHPVLVGSGKVSFAEGFDNCQFGGPAVVDSVAYGTTYSGTVDYMSKFASDLPTSGTQAVVVNNLNFEPVSNATEYSLQTVPVSVPPGANTPRNNAGNTGSILPPDSDGDGVPDASDVCPNDPNNDADNDGICAGSGFLPPKTGSSDNCPNWPNPTQALPPWTVPAGDPDCDGWNTTDEIFITTTATDACGVNAWPPDFNDDTFVNIFDINILKPAFFSTGPNLPYQKRLDLNPDNFINIFDINRLKPMFFLSCTP